TEKDLEYITPRVLELVYTAWDMQPFALDLGYEGEPYQWNIPRRMRLRAELDAYYAKLYGLTKNDLQYILDPTSIYGLDFPSETFRVLKNNEIKLYGEYVTGRLVLAAWANLC
ncbi:MAG: restriction endonuclease, partial [Cylindrospermopsis raciborskii]